MLVRAERLHSQSLNPPRAGRILYVGSSVDVLATEGDVIVLAALPGVDPEPIKALQLILTGHQCDRLELSGSSGSTGGRRRFRATKASSDAAMDRGCAAHFIVFIDSALSFRK
jgi:hypothetical protein